MGTLHDPNAEGETTAKPLYERIIDAQMEVLSAADHLVNEYRGIDGGGTGVGMRAAEDRLIQVVETWRRVCRGD